MFVALRRLERGEAGLQRHGEHALGGQLVQPEVLVAELLDQGLPPGAQIDTSASKSSIRRFVITEKAP